MKLTSRARLPGTWPILAAAIMGALTFSAEGLWTKRPRGGFLRQRGGTAADLPRGGTGGGERRPQEGLGMLVSTRPPRPSPTSEDVHFYQGLRGLRTKGLPSAAAEKTLAKGKVHELAASPPVITNTWPWRGANKTTPPRGARRSSTPRPSSGANRTTRRSYPPMPGCSTRPAEGPTRNGAADKAIDG